MAYIILPVTHTVAQCLADAHNLTLDFINRPGTVTLRGSKRNVSELRTLAMIEGIEFTTDLGK